MKKKKETKIFFLTLVIFATILPVAAAMNENITYIEKTQTQETGNTLYVGGYGPGNYSSIQDAIDNAKVGDTIFVFDDSSPYYETIDISKSINLIGESKETTIIDAKRRGNVIYIDRNSDNIKITGFTIRNSSLTGVDSGVFLYYSPEYINMSDNNIINNNYGICFWAAYHTNPVNRSIGTTALSNCIVSKNNISNNYRGLDLRYANNNIIFNNTISNNSYCGIYLYNSAQNKFYLNNIMNNYKNVINNYLPIYNLDRYTNLWYDSLLMKGNYWDDYNGFDKLPPYGIGDTPYIIPPYLLRNNDNYPLMKPYNGSFVNTQNNQQFQFTQPIQNNFQQPRISQMRIKQSSQSNI